MSNHARVKPCSPDLVIFDLDGTLIDSVPDLAGAVDYSLRKMGFPEAGEARVRQWVGNGAEILIERALAFSRNGSEADHKADLPIALAHFFAYYNEHAAEKTTLYPYVAETLARLHQAQITMAVVTNKPARFVSPILEALQISHYVDCVIGGDDLEFKKPHPLPLLHCMEKLGFNAAQTLMVGDSKNDIEAACNANVLVAAVNYGYNHGRPVAEENPDYLLSDFRQLLSDVIKR